MPNKLLFSKDSGIAKSEVSNYIRKFWNNILINTEVWLESHLL